MQHIIQSVRSCDGSQLMKIIAMVTFVRWEGRVEIFWNGTWGTISYADWGMSEAQVVCTQLQLPLEGKPKCQN